MIFPISDAVQEMVQSLPLISLDALREIMPHLPGDKAAVYHPLLCTALREFEINSPKRVAAFVAQLAHESVELRYFEEIASGIAYEGRKDLGNVNPGDGIRYKGRGPIQLTGRKNYEEYGQELGLDLVSHPEQAAQPQVGFRIAGLYWKKHGLNELADIPDFREITHRINGGYLGEESREAYFEKAKKVLGVI